MKTPRTSHGAALDQYLQDLEDCPPMDPAEELRLALRMRRLRERLARLVGGLPEPLRTRVTGRAAIDCETPFARLEKVIAALAIASGDSPAALEAARRARAVLHVLAGTRATFVKRNLRLTLHLSKRLAGRNAPLPDLVQAGNVGLMEAVDRFDPRRGTRFSTYAAMYITRAVYRALPRMTQAVHVSEYQRRLKHRLLESRTSLLQELGRVPTLEETAARAHLDEEKAKDVLSVSPTILDLDAPFPGSDEGCLADQLADDESSRLQERLIVEDLLSHLQDLLPTLEPRLRQVLRLRYGLEGKRAHTLKEAGDLLSLSRERIRQLEEEALRILRTRLRRLDFGAVEQRAQLA